MCSVVLAPAQIFGLIQMQSKSNPSSRKGIPHNLIIHKSSYVQCNTNKSLRSTLVIFSFWALSVHFSLFGLLQSIWSIQSTLVNQSILVHYSTSVPQVQFSPFGPFAPLGPLWSCRSSQFGPFGLLQSIRSAVLNPVHFSPIQTIWQRTRSFWSSLVHFVHFNLLFPNRHLAVLSMPELS